MRFVDILLEKQVLTARKPIIFALHRSSWPTKRNRMEYRLSDKLNTILSLSKEEAERLMHSEVTANHILLGMLRDGQNKAVQLLSEMGVDLSELRMRLEAVQMPQDNVTDKVPIEKIALSVAVTRLLKISMLESRLQKK